MFEITPKLDIIVLESIVAILHLRIIHTKIYKSKTTIIVINQKDLYTIVNYFFKTIKGIKSLEYRI